MLITLINSAFEYHLLKERLLMAKMKQVILVDPNWDNSGNDSQLDTYTRTNEKLFEFLFKNKLQQYNVTQNMHTIFRWCLIHCWCSVTHT